MAKRLEGRKRNSTNILHRQSALGRMQKRGSLMAVDRRHWSGGPAHMPDLSETVDRWLVMRKRPRSQSVNTRLDESTLVLWRLCCVTATIVHPSRGIGLSHFQHCREVSTEIGGIPVNLVLAQRQDRYNSVTWQISAVSSGSLQRLLHRLSRSQAVSTYMNKKRKDTYLLHLIQIIRLNPLNLLPQRPLNLLHLLPRLLIVHKVDRDTLASETAGSTCVFVSLPQ